MHEFNNYALAEKVLIKSIVDDPHFVTKTTYERLGVGFILMNPFDNQNKRSNYDYAQDFFDWMMTGDKELNEAVLRHNPWVRRFVDTANLPNSFSSSYGWKIAQQLPIILKELKAHPESRRAYINILVPDDKVILDVVTTHEFPCTVGAQLFIRQDKLFMIVNMRSNNVWSVMPYDVYNFTMLQIHIAREIGIDVGWYQHQINNAHIFKGDVRRIKEKGILNTQNDRHDEHSSNLRSTGEGLSERINQDAADVSGSTDWAPAHLRSPFAETARQYNADHGSSETRPSAAVNRTS